ncbi:hypothetical protein [Neobacillus sp. NPDC093127]|uniref:hypothetical protein n=1 Tax=Neobacillus sp. NPDC093127 TaxID=3364296 RepID=UPI0037F99892
MNEGHFAGGFKERFVLHGSDEGHFLAWKERFVLDANGSKPALDFVKNKTGLSCPFLPRNRFKRLTSKSVSSPP